VGARAEAEITLALLAAGWDVYMPVFSAHSRVDLVAVRGDETIRVQCKTARLWKGVLFFRTCSNTNNQPRSYKGEVDAFGVYSPDLRSVYLIPLAGLGESGCSLRLGSPANNQAKGVRYAADYQVRSPPEPPTEQAGYI
jgi:hypothetical protein